MAVTTLCNAAPGTDGVGHLARTGMFFPGHKRSTIRACQTCKHVLYPELVYHRVTKAELVEKSGFALGRALSNSSFDSVNPTPQRPFPILNFNLRKFKRPSNVFQGGAMEYKAE
jgi:hypothetical protein